MKAEFDHKFYLGGKETLTTHKTVTLPFSHISARAIIIRRSDAAILGMLHRVGGSYALPGGAVDNGEDSQTALLRELEEENVQLVGLDSGWQQKLVVDHYFSYHELSLWYILEVKDATFGSCEEIIETRWITPKEDRWYPHMRAKIVLALQQYSGVLAKVYS